MVCIMSLSPTLIQPEFVKKIDDGLLVPFSSIKDMNSVNVDDVKSEKTDEKDGRRHVKDTEKQKLNGTIMFL